MTRNVSRKKPRNNYQHKSVGLTCRSAGRAAAHPYQTGMKISKQAQRDARQLFRSCHVNDFLDENRVRQTVKLLTVQKPRGYVEILSRLHRLVKMDMEQHAARVESAMTLSVGLQDEVAVRIKKKNGAGGSIPLAQKPPLIRGLQGPGCSARLS